MLDRGLKGSGNYGVLGLGAYNGQGGSFLEQNDNLHVVGRLTLPLCVFGGQFMELGAQAYTGKYTVLSSPVSPLGVGPPVRPAGTLETGNAAGLLDQRVAGTFVWYPQPLGFQAEWNVTDRTNTTAINQESLASYRQYDGHLLRFQFQINY